MKSAMLDCSACGARKHQAIKDHHFRELGELGSTRLHCEECAKVTAWVMSSYDRRSGRDRRIGYPDLALEASRSYYGAVEEPRIANVEPLAGNVGGGDPAAASVTPRTAPERRQDFRREHKRVPVGLRVRIRVPMKFEEKTVTSNVSKGGLYFYSYNPYQPKLGCLIMLNYVEPATGMEMEQPGEVVRIDPKSGGTPPGIAVRFVGKTVRPY